MRKAIIDYAKFKLDKDDIMNDAIMRCYRELYKRAQPSADFDKLIKEYKDNVNDLVASGMSKTDAERHCAFYDHYYLSNEEFCYIVDKYIDAYRFNTVWDDYVQLLIDDASKGYSDEEYGVPKWDPKGGKQKYHVDRPSLMKQIKKFLRIDFIGLFSKKLNEIFIKFLENRKWYYRFNYDENKFRGATALGGSPTSDESSVIEYWKSKGVNLNIDKRKYSQDYFWSEENDQLDDYLEYYYPDGTKRD